MQFVAIPDTFLYPAPKEPRLTPRQKYLKAKKLYDYSLQDLDGRTDGKFAFKNLNKKEQKSWIDLAMMRFD